MNNKFFYTYVLRSLKDTKFYIGFTDNLKRRFAEHQMGEVVSTRFRRPFEVVMFEGYLDRYDALRREKYLKTSKGKTTLRYMLKEYLAKN